MTFNKKNFFKNLNKANNIIGKEKSASQKKRESTLEKYKSIAEMQAYIDKSEEKRSLLLEVLKTAIDTESNTRILEKGTVVYVKLLEVIKLIEQDLSDNNIEFMTITGAVTASKRIKIVDKFNHSPSNTVLIISDAGGESLDIRSSNEIILYNIPSGARAFTQTIGRVCRGTFNSANIHLIQIENSIDMYTADLISSRKELELELLHCSTIPLGDIKSFNADLLKIIKKKKLWLNHK